MSEPCGGLMTKTVVTDTNVLVRYLLNDDAHQNAIACQYLDNREIKCVIPMMVFCEIDWLLRKKVKIPRMEIIKSFERLTKKPNIVFDKQAFNMGLNFLKNGGDFADGLIAYQANIYDNATLLTFDKKAQTISQSLFINTAP